MKFQNKTVLLLDMNSTSMFNEDNFGESEDFSLYYHKIGGLLLADEINQIIRSVYSYLDVRYPDENYRHKFPSINDALKSIVTREFSKEEVSKIELTLEFCTEFVADASAT